MKTHWSFDILKQSFLNHIDFILLITRITDKKFNQQQSAHWCCKSARIDTLRMEKQNLTDVSMKSPLFLVHHKN